ncbi:hypothetical protein [Kribbella sp. NPDC055071]|jgi:hypothetical protein
MKNRLITLVDLGLDSSFDASMSFVQGITGNINAGWDQPVIDVNFVRTRDHETAFSALTTPSTVLHVMAHGDHSEEPSFLSTDGQTQVSLRSLADWFLDRQWGISSGVVIADGCKTGIGKWQRAIRDCLQDDITYIGTSTVIGWYEATVFCSAFYGALVRNRGLGRTPAEQGWDAANRAIRAYETLTDARCPYKPVLLTPSRRALRSLTG